MKLKQLLVSLRLTIQNNAQKTVSNTQSSKTDFVSLLQTKKKQHYTFKELLSFSVSIDNSNRVINKLLTEKGLEICDNDNAFY